ncbi:MAG TPA: toll/interleukin-1 receptor domain-containing protein [Pseudomonadota bacterium]|nr:toll/interleukin-1 receptor domain-containing protein [Pseudomonadota bacterium]
MSCIPQGSTSIKAIHTLVVTLADARMTRRALESDPQTAAAWAELVVKPVESTAQPSGPHGHLPVAVDAASLKLEPRLAERSFVRLDRLGAEPAARSAELCINVAVAALLLLLQDKGLAREPQHKARITLFISHAKADFYAQKAAPSEGLVGKFLAYLAQGSIDGWFDSKHISKGARFDEALRVAIERCNVLVCLVTDRWSEGEWCRREVLMAKAAGTPIVIVDALTVKIPRLFPYLGNACAFRWQPGRLQTVVLAALMEALRYRHAIEMLNRRKRDGNFVLGIQPEALTLLHLPAGTRRVIYPDPPLPLEELEALTPPLNSSLQQLRSLELSRPLTEIPRLRDRHSSSSPGFRYRAPRTLMPGTPAASTWRRWPTSWP